MRSDSIGHLYMPERMLHAPCLCMNISANGAPTIFGLVSLLLKALCGGYWLYTKLWPVRLANTLRITELQRWKSTKLWFYGRLSRELRMVSPYKGCLFLVDRRLRSFSNYIAQNEWPKIVVAPFKLSDKIGQEAYSSHLCLWRQSILLLYMTTTNSHFTYLTYRTNNCWRSIDAHFQNGAVSLSPALLRINAVIISFLNVCGQLPLRLPTMQDHNSLTRRWLSFWGWGRECFSLLFDYQGGR